MVCVSPCIAVACSLLTTPFVHADELLRWKFTPGDVWRITHDSDTASTTVVNNKTVTHKVRSTAEIRWQIDSVAAEDIATVTQEIVRLRLETVADGTEVVYDTAAETKPTGAPKEIAAAVQPLLGKKIVGRVNPKGEVIELVDNEQLQALRTAAGGTDVWLRTLLEQPLALVPGEMAAAGKTWQRTSELDLPLGKFQQAVDYKYEGPDDQAAGNPAKISRSAKLTRTGGTNKATLKEQSNQGTILFDAAAGRLREGHGTQELVTSTPYRGGEIVVKVKTTTKVQLQEDK